MTVPRIRRYALLVGAAAAVVAVAVPMLAPIPVRIVYNASDSAPRGWYRIDCLEGAVSLHVGSIVLARLPTGVAAFAAQRGYLPRSVPILKRVGALAPQSVCVRDRVVRIDGAMVATALVHDAAHRPLQVWPQCRRLAAYELFLLSDTNAASFDSRYFGPVAASAVLGVAQPLWTWSAP